MNKYIVRLAIISTIAISSSAAVMAQTAESKKGDVVPVAPPTVPTVDARQSGTWTVGIDEARSSVRLSNTTADPVHVQVVGSGSGRRAFQTRVIVSPINTAFKTEMLPLPAGKRLVIENISAAGRFPAGLHMELNYFSYLDNGDGIADIADLAFHRIALVDQGTFDGTTIATANHKVLVFADATIGTTPLSLFVQARLSGTATGFAQGQITFSGYVEDLPAAP
jgi:hypothetical protein